MRVHFLGMINQINNYIHNMKTNLTQKIISKSLLLAIAITTLSFTSVNAIDFTVPAGESIEFFNQVESNGAINIGYSATATFDVSTLGNNSGGRFNVNLADNANLSLYGTTLYSNLMYGNSTNSIFLSSSSTLYAGSTPMGIAIDVTSGSRFETYAVTEGRVGIQNNSYAEFAAYSVENIILDDNSIWRTNTASTDFLGIYGGSKVELFLEFKNSGVLWASRIDTYYSDANFELHFSNEYIESILADTGSYDFDASGTVGYGTITGDGVINYDITTSNDTYTWTVTSLGGNLYRISDIVVIPEPSTYAMIFGVLALGLAIYRRRK